MLKLLFDQRRVPRTTTREQWREIDRWRRETQREIERHTAQAIADLQTFGRSEWLGLELRIVDRLANPPLLVYPDVDTYA